jgi:hypothetical protein
LVVVRPVGSVSMTSFASRRFRRDGDRFLHSANTKIGIHRCGHRTLKRDAFAFHSGEPGEGKRHRVFTRPQIDDAVLAARVADGLSYFFDERRTGRFNRHARKHGSRCVFDDA